MEEDEDMFGDLFGAFDGDQKADAVEPLASPPAAAAAASAAASTTGTSKRKQPPQQQGEEEGEGPADGGAAGGGKKRARASTTTSAAGGGDGEEGEEQPEQEPEQAAKGAQPTITQHQEIVTPDGRKVISFSALPADYVAPDVSWGWSGVVCGVGLWSDWAWVCVCTW